MARKIKTQLSEEDAIIEKLIELSVPDKTRLANNLYFRISEEKTTTWIFRYTMGKARPEITIGHYPEMSFLKAQVKALDLKADIKKGNYPAIEKKREESSPFSTVDDLAEDWLSICDKRLQHPQVPRRIYRKDIAPLIGNFPLTQINPRDIRRVINKIVESGRPTIANDALHQCKQIFRHGIKLDVIQSNPAEAFDVKDAGGIEESRTRYLKIEEIKHVYEVFRANNKQFSRENYLMVALDILFGGRKCELLRAKWCEFDFDKKTWSVPAPNTKTKVAIVIPLSTLAFEILTELRVRAYGSEYVFPAKKSGTKNGHLSESTINAAINKLFAQGKLKMEHFRVHDLRRTARSTLAELKVPSHIAERCLNHKIKGVEGIYDRYDYFEERKEAQQKLADLLEPIVMPTN